MKDVKTFIFRDRSIETEMHAHISNDGVVIHALRYPPEFSFGIKMTREEMLRFIDALNRLRPEIEKPDATD